MPKMTEPTFDRDGYPTEETLEAIKQWPWEERTAVFPFIASAWHWDDWAKETRPGLWVFATGGWSGNESLIDALHDNPFHYRFGLLLLGSLSVWAVTDAAKQDVEAMESRIVDWAWGKPPCS